MPLDMEGLRQRWNRRWGIKEPALRSETPYLDLALAQVEAREAAAQAPIPTHMTPEEVSALVELARGKYVLEVGSWLGHSTVAMAQVARCVWAVDWHRSDAELAASIGGTFDSARPFLDNLDAAGVRDRVVAVIGRSEEVLFRLGLRAFNLSFLDGGHSADQVFVDARGAIEATTRPGVLAAHDYGLFGVAEGLARAGLRQPTRTVGSLAIFQL